MLKVYFDTKPLMQGHAVRGIGYYTENLLAELKNSKKIKLVKDQDEADIIHFPYFDFFFSTLNPVRGKKNIVTIYDTIPLIYPTHYPSGIKGKINFITQRKKLSQVDSVITISETSKKDIVRFLNVPHDIVFPIHLAASNIYKKLPKGKWETEIEKRYNLPKKFVLYVGDVNYNKNLSNLAEACLLENTPLVIVGKQAKEENINSDNIENKPFFEFLEKYKSNQNIIRLGYVEAGDLVKIYNLATVYCQPSIYEGFGLPVLEAQSCGTPVIATKIQAIVEVFGESCIYSDSGEVYSLAKAIKYGVQTGSKKNNHATGLLNSKKYSWKETANKTIELYLSL